MEVGRLGAVGQRVQELVTKEPKHELDNVLNQNMVVSHVKDQILKRCFAN